MSWEYGMSALAWWIFPVVAGLLAWLWVLWSRRTRTTADSDSLAGYQRFREAMERDQAEPQ
jgi:cytochrome c-type biogenesis protein CcmH/NrfF